MTTITITKELAKKGELVLIPKSEYEEFLNLRKIVRIMKPTHGEKKAVLRGRKEIRSGKHIAWNVLKNELARHSR